VAEGIRIEFSEVAKRFDERVVFRSVSGAADPGEVLAVTGPNGSGKSTLLTILCGLLRPTRGEVCYRSLGGAAAAAPGSVLPPTVFSVAFRVPEFEKWPGFSTGPCELRDEKAMRRRRFGSACPQNGNILAVLRV